MADLSSVLSKQPRRGSAHVECPVEAHVHHEIPLLVRHPMKPVVCGQAGIVDDDVESAEQFGGGGDHRLGIWRVGNCSHPHRRQAPPDRLISSAARRGQVGIAVVDHDLATFQGEARSDGRSDASPAAGDQRHPPVEASAHFFVVRLRCGRRDLGPPSTPLAASCLLNVPCGYAFVRSPCHRRRWRRHIPPPPLRPTTGPAITNERA